MPHRPSIPDADSVMKYANDVAAPSFFVRWSTNPEPGFRSTHEICASPGSEVSVAITLLFAWTAGLDTA